MASQDLAQQLLGLPDVEAQRRFLEAHTPQLNDDVASALKERADHLLRVDITSALKAVDLLYLLAEYTGNLAHRGLGLRAEGNVRSIAMGEYQRAIELYDEAARVYQDQGRLVDQAQSQVGKLWALANLGRYAEALQVGEWASRVLEEHGEWQTLAVLTMNMGIVHSRAGDDAASLEMFNRAEALYRRGRKGNLTGSRYISTGPSPCVCWVVLKSRSLLPGPPGRGWIAWDKRSPPLGHGSVWHSLTSS